MNESSPIRDTIGEAIDEPSARPVAPAAVPAASWPDGSVASVLPAAPIAEAVATDAPAPVLEDSTLEFPTQEPGPMIEAADIAIEAPIIEPPASVLEPPAAVIEPPAPVIEPAAVVIEPLAPVIEPPAALVEPPAPTLELAAPATEPAGHSVSNEADGAVSATLVPDGGATSEVVSEPAVPGIGVLLVNLGTPDAPTPEAVRRYLKEFLSDPRVIEKDTWFWRMVLNGIILPLRSRRKARDYQKIWNNERNESPLKTITRSQAEKLAGILEPLGKHVVVDWAMRYADQPIAARIEALIARGCDRILVMPLYPQYSAATTATVCDEVFRFLMLLRRQPALRILPAYYADPYYIEVLASSLKAELKALPFEPEVIIASYHGMPKEYVIKGDPYESQCVKTTHLLREQLGMDEAKLMMTFQSRFGRARWLEPYTIKTVKALAKKGVKNLVVMTPGFSADCLETLEEIAHDNARTFKRYGGQNFAAIPCLNDSEAGMLMIWQLAMRELKGWV